MTDEHEHAMKVWLYSSGYEGNADVEQAVREFAAVIAREFEALEAENARLREDVKRATEDEVVAHCEGCGAWLLSGDDFVSSPDDCISGCWHTMTDQRSGRDRPCYAYRVGKSDARAALKDTRHDA